MASGFGAKGSEGRCYPLWQGFSKVYRALILLFSMRVLSLVLSRPRIRCKSDR
ncbi:unknown protein [Bathycoccus prasinos]|uniref:Uncharacterized protein n=1 Tax=Bathycoccus prasinos TaxID=41875 RepID=K8F283_9CHLO|nr:unknown protein [Bathycoccus prasinos]CCO66172.1 unknown protein [Bathycoccus prasinos]|eukprot:XP_007512084.1 unknown protein [Bathycoccus prasinos]